MRSFSLLDLDGVAPVDFRRWAMGGALLAAIGYTFVAIGAVWQRNEPQAAPPITTILAALVCWVGVVLVASGRPKLGATLAIGAFWGEVHAAYAFAGVFPAPGLAGAPVTVMAITLLLGPRIGFGVTLLSVAITGPLLALSPALPSGPLSRVMVYWLGVHAAAMVGAWALTSLSLTALGRTVQLLRQREREVEDLIAFAPDGIVIVGSGHRVVTANAAAGRLLGLGPGGRVGDPLPAVLEGAGMRGGGAMIDQAGVLPTMWTFERAGEAPRHLEVTGRRIDWARFQLMLRDVSDRVRSEAAQRDQEARQAHSLRLEAVGQLAGGIAHDFNNLLMTIGGAAELLRDESDPEQRTGLLDQLVVAQERGATLTRQLLAFARRDVVRPTVLDLAAMIEQQQPLLQSILGDAIRLVCDLDADCRVRADLGQLEQVLVSLVSNARDAMPSGGCCKITVRHAADGDGMRLVQLTVRDDGVGMDADTAARVFEPFFTTKARGRGTGLGLASVHGTVVRCGGRVTVESSIGAGAAIVVTLPLVAAPVESAEPRAGRPDLAAGTGVTIVVVDDDDSTRAVVGRILRRAGYRVELSPDGLQALRTIESTADVALVVTDVSMPGLSGPEMAQALADRRPSLPILFMSGYPREAITENGGLLPEHDLLTKPFAAQELLERVSARLAGAAPLS